MSLANLAGINIPDIKLIELNKLDNLPQINLPDEKLAFAIKRFDREGDTRIHMEDFDQVTPRLSPAYDIVTTRVYMDGEKKYALNPGKTKEWYSVTMESFESWANKSGIPWRAIKPHIDDTMEKARSLWPEALKDLPMDAEHKAKLKAHWLKLQSDFRIEKKIMMPSLSMRSPLDPHR